VYEFSSPKELITEAAKLRT